MSPRSKSEQCALDYAFNSVLYGPGHNVSLASVPQKDSTEYTKEEIEIAFEYFTSQAQKIVSNYMDTSFPELPKETIRVEEGRVYWKLTRSGRLNGGGRQTHAFVRKRDGAVFRPAGPKTPYTKGKSAIRAYVTDDWAASVLTPHGVAYVR